MGARNDHHLDVCKRRTHRMPQHPNTTFHRPCRHPDARESCDLRILLYKVTSMEMGVGTMSTWEDVHCQKGDSSHESIDYRSLENIMWSSKGRTFAKRTWKYDGQHLDIMHHVSPSK